jgi:hypothetical protein
MYEPTKEKRQHIVLAQTVGTGVSVCAEGRETEGTPPGGERKKKKKKKKKKNTVWAQISGPVVSECVVGLTYIYRRTSVIYAYMSRTYQ